MHSDGWGDDGAGRTRGWRGDTTPGIKWQWQPFRGEESKLKAKGLYEETRMGSLKWDLGEIRASTVWEGRGGEGEKEGKGRNTRSL